MGVTLLRNIDEEYNEYRNVGTDHGVLISVQEGGPAAQAGLVDYDIITAVDGTEILDVYHLQETIFYKGIMPSEKVLDFPVDCNTLTGSVNL